MTEYFDLLAGDDVDLFAFEGGPLEVLRQDLEHELLADPGSFLLDPDHGIGLRNVLSSPMPPDLSELIKERFERDDRVARATVTIAADPTERDAYRYEIVVEARDGFVEIVLAQSATDIKVVR